MTKFWKELRCFFGFHFWGEWEYRSGRSYRLRYCTECKHKHTDIGYF